jgi:hypothetical protein
MSSIIKGLISELNPDLQKRLAARKAGQITSFDKPIAEPKALASPVAPAPKSDVNPELQKRLAARKAGKPVYSGGLEEGADRQAELEMALQKARQITKQIKYDDTATDIIVQIQMLAEKFNIDKDSLESAIDDVYNAKNQLESAVYGLDEVFEEALQQSRWDDDEILDENLRKWFKEKWVRFGPDGKIRGDCARGDDSEGKPKCLPQSKAHSLGKKGRASAAARKRREDPNPERRGPAKNVATKKKSNEGVAEGSGKNVVKSIKVGNFRHDLVDTGMGWQVRIYNGDELYDTGLSKNSEQKGLAALEDAVTYTEKQTRSKRQGVAEAELDEACWKGYHKEGNKKMFGKTYPNCVKNTNEEQEQLDEKCWDTHKQVGMKSKGGKIVPNCVPKESVEEGHQQCPECGGAMYEAEMMNEKKDACYYKVKSRYKVWPSAYASGALVKCRKKGASNWGTGGKKNEGIEEDTEKLEKLKKLLYRNRSNTKEFGKEASLTTKELDLIRNEIKRLTAKANVPVTNEIAGNMGQGGNAGQSYRKYKVKPSGIAQGISETEAVNRNDGDGWHWYDIKPAGQ